MIKFGFSEKATKFEKIFVVLLTDKSVVFCARNSVLVKKIFKKKCGQVMIQTLTSHVVTFF